MTKNPTFALYMLILTDIGLKGTCIQCYQCNSLTDDVRGCSVSPPNLVYLKNCSLVHKPSNERFREEEIWCRKIRNYRMPSKPWHKRSVVRECAYKHWDDEICYKGTWQIICECNGSGCNGATTQAPINTFSIIALALSQLLWTTSISI
ncbi:uncharacterized protein LOC113375571 [Ctenocephalides felis]|uniref:uncharacterized protein LOC113375571 n=1 Tax=Ctenocephalides felis TaxID=7515 RepID=UPI000E6E183B|nr:uncharacterized protein LOC113375571 [Ctenocephalides felis]